jgi:hypothetical protein
VTTDNKQLESVRGKTKLVQKYKQPLPKYDPPHDILTQWLNYADVDLLQVQTLSLGLINTA